MSRLCRFFAFQEFPTAFKLDPVVGTYLISFLCGYFPVRTAGLGRCCNRLPLPASRDTSEVKFDASAPSRQQISLLQVSHLGLCFVNLQISNLVAYALFCISSFVAVSLGKKRSHRLERFVMMSHTHGKQHRRRDPGQNVHGERAEPPILFTKYHEDREHKRSPRARKIKIVICKHANGYNSSTARHKGAQTSR